jgi:hypothetical protein
MSGVTKFSLWRHTNGAEYMVIALANFETAYPDIYPITVVYESCSAGTVWCRPLSDWARSMTKIEEIE